MATLTELARFHTALDGRAVNHLQRLVAGWGLLADFCFADLLLFAPTIDAPDGERFLVLSPGAAVHLADRVPGRLDRHHGRRGGAPARRPGVPRSARSSRARPPSPPSRSGCACCASRSGCRGEVIGVLTRESAPSFGRQPGELERTYVDDLQPVRPDDRRRRLPVRRRGRRDRGGAARRRRRDPARSRRRGWSTRRRTACRRCTASACTPTPRGCASASWASTTTLVRDRVRDRARPVTEEIERAGRRVRPDPLHPADRPRGRVGRGGARSATSPSCAAATGCCCRRTPRSARSTTG